MNRRAKYTTIGVLLVALAGAGISLWSAQQNGRQEKQDAEAEAEAVISIDAGSVITKDFLGGGYEWDPSDSYAYTDEQWKLITDRVAFTRAPLIRLMFRANAYTTGWNEAGEPVYDWESPAMQRIYRILDYCEANGIGVIIGEWSRSTEIGITASDDPRWARIIGDSLDHFLNEKKYTVLRYYNFINEPNGAWATEAGNRFAIWSRGLRNLEQILREKRLSERIPLIGPDSSNQDDWVDKTVMMLSDAVSAYDVHRYAADADILSGSLEAAIRGKREVIDSGDPAGTDKPFLLTEAGIVEGKDEEHDQQERVKTFEYGVLMTDFAIQSMRGGQAGFLAWMLDDSMHDAPGYPAGSGQLKTWGFWNSVGDEQDRKLRPWFYPMSLFSRYFPQGSQIAATEDSGIEGVRTAAAVIPAGTGSGGGNAGSGYTIAAVNSGAAPHTVRICVPGATEPVDLNRYVYADGASPADAAGYPVPEKRLALVRLDQGVTVTLQAKSAVFLTTLE